MMNSANKLLHKETDEATMKKERDRGIEKH